MLIMDSHADTLYAMQNAQRDPVVSLDVTREHLRRPGDVRIQALALFTGPTGLKEDAGLVARELEMLELLKSEGFRQITRVEEAEAGAANVLLTVEGGEVFHGGVDTVDRFFDLGVRMAALVWNNENQLAYPAIGGSDLGLTDYGREIVARMRALGMAVDVSHMNEQGVKDLLARGGPAPLASHSCARALCGHPRNLSDDQLKALFAAGGYVGVNFYPVFLDDSKEADIDRVIDHMAHMCALGGEKHVGLGSDFDGIEIHPKGLRHAGQVHDLLDRMKQRGFGDDLMRDIAGENLARYLASVER